MHLLVEKNNWNAMDSELVTEMFALFIKPIYDILKEIPNCMAFVRVINHSKIGTYNWPWIANKVRVF